MYAQGAVVNYVASSLQDEVMVWLQGEAWMREVVGEFRMVWPEVMDRMRTEYAEELQEYHAWVVQEAQKGRSDLERVERIRREAVNRRELEKILREAEPSAVDIEVDKPGSWLVRHDNILYALPAAVFDVALLKGLWTDRALSVLKEQHPYFLARRGGRLYICEKRQLKKSRRVDERLRALMRLPEADLAHGLLRCPDVTYRVRPDQIKLITDLSDTLTLRQGCFRVEISRRTVAVQPDDKRYGLKNETAWNAWIAALPEAELDGDFITTIEGTEYVRTGPWPAEPKQETDGCHKILTPDGILIARLNNPKHFKRLRA
ncbi:hypothetical protein ACFYPT_42540, partial [Streptomyces sp. NPDC005529]